MPKQELDSLVRTGQLKAEAPSAGEVAGLIKSAEDRLRDADRQENSVSSRFDLAYNAAHSFALAALRWHGYPPDQRYIIVQALAHTISIPAMDERLRKLIHSRTGDTSGRTPFRFHLSSCGDQCRVTPEA